MAALWAFLLQSVYFFLVLLRSILLFTHKLLLAIY